MENYVTTTELRTKTPIFVKTLKSGGSFSLVHRSKIIGKIEPAQGEISPIKDIGSFSRALVGLTPKKRFSEGVKRLIYRKRLEKKYGARVS